MWEARNKEKNCLTHTKKSALKLERKEPEKICFGCGKPGHMKANCRNIWIQGSTQGSRRNNAIERIYGQGGAYQSYQRRGSRDRGTYQRGRGWQSAAKGTDATTPKMKMRAHLTLRY